MKLIYQEEEHELAFIYFYNVSYKRISIYDEKGPVINLTCKESFLKIYEDSFYVLVPKFGRQVLYRNKKEDDWTFHGISEIDKWTIDTWHYYKNVQR